MATGSHHARCYWFTGLPAAGKTTLADRVHKLLEREGVSSVVLDGDRLRTGINSDLGFSAADRSQSVRRTSEVAKLMVDAGLVTLVSLVSPFRTDRFAARNRFEASRFYEVFVDTALDICISRDPKGLYRRAMAGELPNLTGLNDPYEAPRAPDFLVRTPQMSVDDAARVIFTHCLQGTISLTVEVLP